MEKLILDQISVDDLISRLAVRVREEIHDYIPSPEPPEKYLTRKETAKLLQISLVTLNEWSKKGIIQSYRIGGRIRYKKTEIDEALKEVKNLKYRRE
jgi:excisionase family DNA binding protein